jgi:hypothetical protein
MPGFSVNCGETTTSIENLRGRAVHLTFVPEEAVEQARDVLQRDHALGVITIIGSLRTIDGLEAGTCASSDPGLIDTLATYRGLDLSHDVSHMGRTEWLVDGAGFLRSMWYPQPSVGEDWADETVFAKAVRELQLQPAAPKRAIGHVHH